MLAELVGPIERPSPIHPAVARAIVRVNARLDERVTLASIAREVELSEDRLRHAFVESVGIPFRRFVLWRRMTAATAAFEAGRSLTVAAHEAGFSDSAHLTRTFRQMFGLAPSEALSGIEWVVAHG